jgi:hypothetical protein
MFFTVAFLALILTSGVRAQTPARKVGVALSPVPIWPRDGNTSQLPKGQYVFYDPSSAEYVVYCTRDSAGGSPAQPTILRFGSHSLVNPDVMFNVAPVSDGNLRYTYDVANGDRARQSIQKVGLVTFSDSSPRASRLNWTAHATQHRERDLDTSTTGGAVIDWTQTNAALSIAPGSTAQDFAVDSTSLPGFINMTFQGLSKSSQYSPEAVASLPKEVGDQLARVFSPASDAQSLIVIGPRFAKGTSQSIITQNYLFGLYMLVLHRELDPNSPFVQNAQQTLTAQLHSQDQMRLDAASLDFTKQAKPGLETAIANALEFALAQ